MAAAKVFTFEDPRFAEHRFVALLFTDVANMAAVRGAVLDKSLDVAALEATTLVSPFALHLAAYKALYNQHVIGKIRAASLHAELVHCLSGSRNVGEGLRLLGASEATTSLLVGLFDPSPETIAAITSLVQGGLTCFDSFYSRLHSAGAPGVDAAAVAAAYSVAGEELGLASSGSGKAAVPDWVKAHPTQEPGFWTSEVLASLEAAVVGRIGIAAAAPLAAAAGGGSKAAP